MRWKLSGFLIVAVCAAGVARGDERCAAHLVPFTDSGKAAQMQYGRGRPMDIKHIRLDVRVDVLGEKLEGSATHTLAPVGAPLSTAEFDAQGLDVARVTLGDGREVSFESTGEKLKMFLPAQVPAGEEIVLKIDYSVTRPLKGMHFRTPRMGYQGDEVQCWTQGEAEDARAWFPCFDAPHERTTTEVAATVPAEFRAVSNGELVDAHDNAADGSRTYHYRLAKEHTTYLVSLAVGRFVEVRDDSGPVPLYFYVLPGQEEKAKLSYGKTADMMRYFEQLLGVPYPWGRYSQVAVVDFIAGGMENTSITTMTERSLQDAPARLTNLSEHLVAHELAHQWFGDLVTCRDWTNIWLNEGWATYLETCYIGHAMGDDMFFHRMWENAKDVFETDKPDNRLATVRRVWGDPEALFDARVYEKGAWILHMLRRHVGEDVFWRAVNAYLAQFANQAVETNDLMRAFEKVSGEGLEQFFDQWVYHAGWPEFRVKYDWDNDKSLATVRVEQIHKTDDKTLLFSVRTKLRFAGKGFSKDEDIKITEKEHTFILALPSKPDYVRFDPEYSLLKSVDFDKSKDMLIAQLTGDPTVAGRYEACEALGKVKDPAAVNALIKSLEGDAFWGVRARAAEALAEQESPAAETALIAAIKQTEARVRLAAARSLAKLDTDAVIAALEECAAKDESPYVSAAALDSLGQNLGTVHAEVLMQALARESQNQVVRNAALNALARLQPENALAAIAPFTKMDAPRMSRATALSALGTAGQWQDDKAPYRAVLLEALDAPSGYLRRTAAGALGVLGDPQATPALEAYALAAKDALEARAGRENAAKLRERNTAPQALRELQQQLDAIKKELTALQEEKKKNDERLEALEKSTKKAGK